VKTVATIESLRATLAEARERGQSIGFVPTMGALHEGHLSLLHKAAAECDLVVVSIFVNPTQFRPGEDLEKYPRKMAADAALADLNGADILFAPGVDEIYPSGATTTVSVSGISETLCGDPSRRGHQHFDGVATVVSKLFNIVQPDAAYFGQKDAQQLAVIKRLVSDLNMPVRVVGCPTVRESDGLAMSSRNAFLAPAERKRACALNHALRLAEKMIAGGARDVAAVKQAALRELSAVEVEYFELVDPLTMQPVEQIEGPVLAAVAAHVGATRLIDNLILQPVSLVTSTTAEMFDNFPSTLQGAAA